MSTSCAFNEHAVVFDVHGESLPGIVHHGAPGARCGVLVIVGGPQYRVGSHRQFVLLARRLAAEGVPVFRFDYRGMGDATGAPRDFEAVREDIHAAIEAFTAQSPGLKDVVLWGLCDAASAALDYGWRDARVKGMVLLNPWVRTDEGLARAYLKHYYLKRLSSRQFWQGLASGKVDLRASFASLLDMVARTLKRGSGVGSASGAAGSPAGNEQGFARGELAPGEPLPVRMAAGWKRFDGRICLILSGDDLTAAEFRDSAEKLPAWRGLLEGASVSRYTLNEANHTFSRREWRASVEEWTLEFLRKC